jgi:hypothetical protein
LEILKTFTGYAVRSTRNEENRVSQLVEFLCKGDHPIEATLREKTREAMKEAIARGHVPIKFTDTRGGTELVVPLDMSRSDLREIRVVGDLTLDYVRVTCVARIDLATLQGEGHLEVR